MSSAELPAPMDISAVERFERELEEKGVLLPPPPQVSDVTMEGGGQSGDSVESPGKRAMREGKNLLDQTDIHERKKKFRSLYEEVKEFSELNEETESISEDLRIFTEKQNRLFGIGVPVDVFKIDAGIIKSEMQLVNKRFLRTVTMSGGGDTFSTEKYAMGLRMFCLTNSDYSAAAEHEENGSPHQLTLHQMGALARTSWRGGGGGPSRESSQGGDEVGEVEPLPFSTLPLPFVFYRAAATRPLPIFYHIRLPCLEEDAEENTQQKKEHRTKIRREATALKTVTEGNNKVTGDKSGDDYKETMWEMICKYSERNGTVTFLQCTTDYFYMTNLSRNILTLSSLVQEKKISYAFPSNREYGDLGDAEVAESTKLLLNRDESEEGKRRFAHQHPVEQGHVNVTRHMWMEYYLRCCERNVLPFMSCVPVAGTLTDWGVLPDDYDLLSEPMASQLIKELIIPQGKSVSSLFTSSIS